MNTVNHTLELLHMLCDGPTTYKVMRPVGDPILDPGVFLQDLGLVLIGHGVICITPLGVALHDRLLASR